MTLTVEQLKDVAQWPALALPLLIRLLAAVAIFYIGKWAVAAIVSLTRRVMHRSRTDEILTSFVANVLYGVLLTLVVIAALTQIGVDTTSAAAVVAGAALAVGLSLQNQLSSLAAGVIMILTRPFRKGDLVELAGITGIVEDLTIVATVLRSPNNEEVILPNSAVLGRTIINYTARPLRRIDVTIGIAYGADLLKAKRVIQGVLSAEPRVLKDPAPTVQVKALGPNSVDLAVNPWVPTGDKADVEAALLEQIKLQLDAEGIEMPAQRVKQVGP
jgi:small conductance mechanosensitive channel